MAYPLPSLAAVVTSAGISAPSYTDVLESLKASFRAIYGSDAYLEADSQDGQWVAIIAKGISDCNDAAIAAYSNMSPLTAVGEGLSSVVKINGIVRSLATNSQVSVVLTGGVGVIITNGKIRDSNGNTWSLPSPTTIGGGGTVTVTAVCDTIGEINAAANKVNIIGTPVSGWNTVTNPAAATPGVPVETDAGLRRRQADSVALPALNPLVAMLGAIKNVAGVTDARIYENATGATDANGITEHAVAAVVRGGGSTAVATAIMNKKTPGCNLFGSTTVALVDAVGETQSIKFTIPASVTVKCQINLTALTGYTTDVGTAIKNVLKAYWDALPIGTKVYWNRSLATASLMATPEGSTFEINSFLLFRDAGTPDDDDVVIDWDEKPVGNVANIAITVV